MRGAGDGAKLSDQLSQEEVSALLQSLEEEDENRRGRGRVADRHEFTPYEGPATKQIGNRTCEIYDFRRPDKFSKDQLRTLQMLHETFARLASTSLSGFLRTSVSIELKALEQIPFEEYLKPLNRSAFNIVSIWPLSGEAAMEMEFDLVFMMIDKLLGGTGKSVKRSILTEIEQPLMQHIVERILATLKTSWEAVMVVIPALEGLETNTQFVQIAPPNDIVVGIFFEVRVGEMYGGMSLCIPHMLLRPITPKLSAQKWFAASTSKKQTAASRKSISSHILDSEVECAVQLGTGAITFSDFKQLTVGDVIRLDQKVDQDIRMLVGGQTKYHGRAALDGGRMAFSINEKINQR